MNLNFNYENKKSNCELEFLASVIDSDYSTIRQTTHKELNNSAAHHTVEKLKNLVASERKITAAIIETIQTIDKQKIYLQLGFANLYSFLTEHIGYTAASAQRRIEAARLLTSVR